MFSKVSWMFLSTLLNIFSLPTSLYFALHFYSIDLSFLKMNKTCSTHSTFEAKFVTTQLKYWQCFIFIVLIFFFFLRIFCLPGLTMQSLRTFHILFCCPCLSRVILLLPSASHQEPGLLSVHIIPTFWHTSVASVVVLSAFSDLFLGLFFIDSIFWFQEFFYLFFVWMLWCDVTIVQF